MLRATSEGVKNGTQQSEMVQSVAAIVDPLPPEDRAAIPPISANSSPLPDGPIDGQIVAPANAPLRRMLVIRTPQPARWDHKPRETTGRKMVWMSPTHQTGAVKSQVKEVPIQLEMLPGAVVHAADNFTPTP
jgi:hypothetical protein